MLVNIAAAEKKYVTRVREELKKQLSQLVQHMKPIMTWRTIPTNHPYPQYLTVNSTQTFFKLILLETCQQFNLMAIQRFVLLATLGLVVFGLETAVSQRQQQSQVPCLYIFGDSLVDNGNNNRFGFAFYILLLYIFIHICMC